MKKSPPMLLKRGQNPQAAKSSSYESEEDKGSAPREPNKGRVIQLQPSSHFLRSSLRDARQRRSLSRLHAINTCFVSLYPNKHDQLNHQHPLPLLLWALSMVSVTFDRARPLNPRSVERLHAVGFRLTRSAWCFQKRRERRRERRRMRDVNY